MKSIHDLSVFHWPDRPKASHFKDMTFYYNHARTNYRVRPLDFSEHDNLLRLESIVEVCLLPTAHYLRQNANFLSLEYVMKGSLLVHQRQTACELEAGEAFLMHPQLESEFQSGSQGCHKLSVTISGSEINQFLDMTGLIKKDVLTKLDKPALQRLFQRISELADEENTHTVRNSTLAFELLQTLCLIQTIESFPPHLVTLKKTIEDHPEKPWSIADMARICNCSKQHLTRLFRHHFHTTPHQYLINTRIRIAKQLLADDTIPIKEIAIRVGFPNALNFSTAFHKITGMPPTAYRQHLLLLI